ncbi:hypothetical protein ACL02S_07945 [Nocardia sp. 004]|uniref:hypothetical protein n=1 Tax=Nocardia sp. 004 TaxID=3385978 RepID=UPI0039A14653
MLTAVEPGRVDTDLRERQIRYLTENPVRTAYSTTRMEILDAGQTEGVTPEKIATRIRTAIEANRPHPLYTIGNNAPAMLTVRRISPARSWNA